MITLKKRSSTPISQKTIEFGGKYMPIEFGVQQLQKYKALKSHCGSGGTNVLLTSLDPCIVLTPNTPQVKGKERSGLFNQPENVKVLYIYQDSTDKFHHVEKWQNKGFIVHIYSTYAQLKTNQKNVLQYSDSHRLVCDEFHCVTANEYMSLLEATTIAVNKFKRVIMTTATENAVPIFNTLPVIYYKGIDKPQIPVEFIRFQTLKEINAHIKKVQKTLSNDTHIIIVSNNVKVHNTFFESPDHYVGDTLERKIAIHHYNENFVSFDYSKKIHIISAAAWEGVDFIHDAVTFIIGEYSHNKFMQPYAMTKINVFQSSMRSRERILKTQFLYTHSKNYFENLDNTFTDETFTDETKAGIKQLFEFKQNDAFKRIDIDSIVLTKPQDFTKTPAEIFRNLSKYDKSNDTIENILEHININRIVKVNRDNETMRNGRQFGLNTKETLFYLSYGITFRANGFDAFYKWIFPTSRQDKNHALMFDQIFKAISKAYQTQGFLSEILTHDSFYCGDIRLNAFGRVIYDYIISSVINCKSSNSIAYTDKLTSYYNNNVKMSEQANEYIENQHDTASHKRAIKLKEIFINFIVFNSLQKKSSIIKKAEIEAEDYIKSKLYQIKTKNDEQPITKKQLLINHKMFIIEKLLAYHNRTNIIELRRGYRLFSMLTSHARPLRKISPLMGSEIDIRSAYPTIVGNIFSPTVKAKIENGSIYASSEMSKDDKKIQVNKAFNMNEQTHSMPERIDELIKVGMLKHEAYNFATRFAKKGSFYEFASEIEQQIINKLFERLEVIKTPKHRLHDSIFCFGDYDLSFFTDPIKIESGVYYLSCKNIVIKEAA